MDWYRSVARPLLFSIPPEAAHRLAQGLLGLPLPWERLGGADRDPALRLSLAGIPLANPVGLAAGFDKTGRHVDALGRLGFGYVVCGTFTRRPRRGNAKPRIVRYPERASMVNAMGLPNPGAEAASRALGRTAPRGRPGGEHRRPGPPRRARDPRGPGAVRRCDRAERELPERRVGPRPRQRGPPREPAARAREPPGAAAVRQAAAVPHRGRTRGGARARRDREGAGRRRPHDLEHAAGPRRAGVDRGGEGSPAARCST